MSRGSIDWWKDEWSDIIQPPGQNFISGVKR